MKGPFIQWFKGFVPKGRNLADILAEMDARGESCGPDADPFPIVDVSRASRPNIQPLDPRKVGKTKDGGAG